MNRLELHRPLVIQPSGGKSARLLVEKLIADHGCIGLTCIANDNRSCQGVFLSGHDLPPLILALVEQLWSVEDLGALLEQIHALYTTAAQREARWFATQDQRVSARQ